MQKIRRLHLYLGCFFAPLLIFFIATGWYQTAHPDRRKSLGEQDTVIDRLRAVHTDQAFPVESANRYATTGVRWLIYSMSFALLLTVLLGIVLAFRSLRQRWHVWASLSLGILVPVLFLWLGQRR